MTDPSLNEFPIQASDKLRFGDTDAQGHVNNAVFSTFFETGRVELLLRLRERFKPSETGIVIARICIDYRREIRWPGTVQCGTAVLRIGGSSVTLKQALFQNDVCVAIAESVSVQVSSATHRATPLDEETKARLAAFMIVQS